MSKVLLIVNPSSGGEKAKSYEDLAREKLAKCFDEVVVKHTEKAETQQLLLSKQQKTIMIASLSWAAMEQSMKESAAWLN